MSNFRLHLRRIEPDSMDACVMLAAWRSGCDTLQIARIVRVPEHVVYNTLATARGHSIES